ncbi:DUF188 domain-containing protein [Peribacillus sp. SCS-26]|uniref:DUF188 domain-containing protein n=1 Tax=Paraperibacillus marinus TaxID=3115295 RepID=UPI003906533F
MCFVTSINNMMSEPSPGKWVYVGEYKGSCRSVYPESRQKGDVIITGDIGVAGTLLPKHVYVLSPRGKEYTENNIDTLLDMRYLSAKSRRQGKYTKGPKPFTNEDRLNFVRQLSKILSNHAGNKSSLEN